MGGEWRVTEIIQGCCTTKRVIFMISDFQKSTYVSRNVTIIGGRGRMGKFFQEQLSLAGHRVSILENEDWDQADRLLNHAELVLVGVPIEWTQAVIEQAAPHLQPTTALCDITSVKTLPVNAMLAHHCGPVMGLHPMFGPSITSFFAQKVVITPGRNDEAFHWLIDLVKSQGGETIICTPEEHDRLMVVVQAIRQFSRFGLGVYLADEQIDLDKSMSMSTPSYRTEIDILKRLFAQSPQLCVDIMLACEERNHAIAQLAKTYTRLADLIAQKDRAGLIQEFETTHNFFAQETVSELVGTLR